MSRLSCLGKMWHSWQNKRFVCPPQVATATHLEVCDLVIACHQHQGSLKHAQVRMSASWRKCDLKEVVRSRAVISDDHFVSYPGIRDTSNTCFRKVVYTCVTTRVSQPSQEVSSPTRVYTPPCVCVAEDARLIG